MPTVRFALNDEYYERLEKDAAEAHMNIQNYIRLKLFNERTIFTVEEAVRRIQNGYFENREFTLPDAYGYDWTMSREDGAGSLGKYFNAYILEHPEFGITYIPDKTIKRRAVYTFKR